MQFACSLHRNWCSSLSLFFLEGVSVFKQHRSCYQIWLQEVVTEAEGTFPALKGLQMSPYFVKKGVLPSSVPLLVKLLHCALSDFQRRVSFVFSQFVKFSRKLEDKSLSLNCFIVRMLWNPHKVVLWNLGFKMFRLKKEQNNKQKEIKEIHLHEGKQQLRGREYLVIGA